MNPKILTGWESLRHGGLLLDLPRLRAISDRAPSPLPSFYERQLRQQSIDLKSSRSTIGQFVSFVLEEICGFSSVSGTWYRGSAVGSQWGRRLPSGEIVKPRHIWLGSSAVALPVFIDREPRIGSGRGRRSVSEAINWLRAGSERLAIITNGQQWRLTYAGLDFDAWCEWDTNLWFEEGALSAQVDCLRTLLSPKLWVPPAVGALPILLKSISESRRGQAELSKELGERVREAVEVVVQAHGEALKEHCATIEPREIYRAAVRVVMRMVVILFAESRELLPRENPMYQASYGLTGLIEDLQRIALRSGDRLSRSWNAWPRILALFKLVEKGSYHPNLPVPAYGGELFASSSASTSDELSRALLVFEQSCFDREVMNDREVYRVLEFISRTRIKLRQGRSTISVSAPVDFTDLSSEYIGILYEGLLDFELRAAAASHPIIFLSIGSEPALPLSRLESMRDEDLAALFEKLKETTSENDDAEIDADLADSLLGRPSPDEAVPDDDSEMEADQINVGPETANSDDVHDERHATRLRAEQWARRAVVAAKLVRKPRRMTSPADLAAYEGVLSRKARQLVARVVLPGEWYLVRWGGTRKGTGTFYTRAGLAVPTVHRVLERLVFNNSNDFNELNGSTGKRSLKTPEEILAIKVCDPACGSGTFPVAALRYLTETLYSSLRYHRRISEDDDRTIIHLLSPLEDIQRTSDSSIGLERLPCRTDDPQFELRLKAILRRHVLEHSIYGVDRDPLAVELCRLALWIETMDRTLPFTFLDHKIKCGNALIGTWFDNFRHYPVMAWKNRDAGDENHRNGVHYPAGSASTAIKQFLKEKLAPDLRELLTGPTLLSLGDQVQAQQVHTEALSVLSRIRDLPVSQATERAIIYRQEFLDSEHYHALKLAMDMWCACWFWPLDKISDAPLPTTLTAPSDASRAICKQLQSTHQFFHWELEFPDVFLDQRAGFDAVIGNPPWDIAKPNSKEFFSNIDPLYRSYGKQEALLYQTELFRDRAIETAWLTYTSDFRAQSNFFKYAATAYGDPATSTASDDRFVIARGKENDKYHSRWRSARAGTRGFSDPRHPYQHQGSADVNLYKAFLEAAHALLSDRGRLGLIVPSGIYSDQGCRSLRRLFLDNCCWEWLFNFINWEEIFPSIYYRFKFNAVIVEKGGATAAINAAFVRTNVEDWEHAEQIATRYPRELVDQFSPTSLAILEIQSSTDLVLLSKIYSASDPLVRQDRESAMVSYSREFDMTNDSKLFPPRTKWEALGYRPDEYSRWLKGHWQPLESLWGRLRLVGVDPGARRSAQPPYDRLPIPRADLPRDVILSRDADAWMFSRDIEDVALPLYEGRMIGQLDFSEKGWLSGRGRSASWPDISWREKDLRPQYLMAMSDFHAELLEAHLRDIKQQFGKEASAAERDRLNEDNAFLEWWTTKSQRVGFMDVTSATNARTVIASCVPLFPCGNGVPVLTTMHDLSLVGALSSFVVDFVARRRVTGLHLNYFIMSELCVPTSILSSDSFQRLALSLAAPHRLFCAQWLKARSLFGKDKPANMRSWALTDHERARQRCIIDALCLAACNLSLEEARYLLLDHAEGGQLDAQNPNGFWRVDKDKPRELRQNTLSFIAYHDLRRCVDSTDGDMNMGIARFVEGLDGDGWQLPGVIQLGMYGLRQDDPADSYKELASALGPRFVDWQLEQESEEFWREMELHAANLYGDEGLQKIVSGAFSIAADAHQQRTPRTNVADLQISLLE